MKSTRTILATVLSKSVTAVFVLSSTVGAFAQGITYLSTLANPAAASSLIGSDYWAAQTFRTGTSPGGYDVDFVQLMIEGYVQGATGFVASLYADSDGFPGSKLGQFSGSSVPTNYAIYTYTAVGMRLLPNADYWIVVNAGTPISIASFQWAFMPYDTASYNASDNWSIPGDLSSAYIVSHDSGSSWHLIGSYALFAINATPVPQMTISVVSSNTVQVAWDPELGGFALQETMNLSPLAWTNSPSGTNNPVTISAGSGAKFFRIVKP